MRQMDTRARQKDDITEERVKGGGSEKIMSPTIKTRASLPSRHVRGEGPTQTDH